MTTWTESIEGRISLAVNLMAHYLVETALNFSPEFDEPSAMPTEEQIKDKAATDGGLRTMLLMSHNFLWPNQGNFYTQPTAELRDLVLARALEVREGR